MKCKFEILHLLLRYTEIDVPCEMQRKRFMIRDAVLVTTVLRNVSPATAAGVPGNCGMAFLLLGPSPTWEQVLTFHVMRYMGAR